MAHLQEIRFGTRSLERFVPLLGEAAVADARRAAERLRARLGERVIWNVSSTAVGGGVAEMLASLLAYSRGVGVDVRWLVLGGTSEFFHVTKRLHHALHGEPGDGSPLGEDEHRVYEAVLQQNAVELRAQVQPGDIVLLHDPQPAGLAPALLASGAIVIWRCHIGRNGVNAESELGWRFLERYLEEVPAFVFSRESYVPMAYRDRAVVVQPSIDAFSAKNVELDEPTIRSILVHVGLVEGPMPDPPRLAFVRGDGTPSRVERQADVIRLGRAATWDDRLVVQVSRWDSLKDMRGVLLGFARLVTCHADTCCPHLVLAGPNVRAVADDPEGPAVFEEVLRTFREQPHSVRARIHLATLPTADVEENAVIVNALQRHAAVVVQKSLREGFGLTVTEAMWKGRPIVASAVGGIVEQIEDGVSGILLPQPTDLNAFAGALACVLSDRAFAARLGAAARERVVRHFLSIGHLLQYADLIERLEGAAAPARAA